MKRGSIPHLVKSDFLTSLASLVFGGETFFKLRRKLIDSPHLIVSGKLPSPLAFAFFSLAAPFFVALSLDGLASTSGAFGIAKTPAILANAQHGIELSDKMLAQSDLPAGIRVDVMEKRSDFQYAYDQIVAYEWVNSKYLTYYYIISQLMILLNAFAFARIFNRFYPIHKFVTDADNKKIVKIYLYCTGTTLFIPNILASFGIVLVFILERQTKYVLPEFAPTVSILTALPLVSATILSASRIYRLSTGHNDWNITKTVVSVLLSNFISGMTVALLSFIAFRIWVIS
jgi:hypothetical protein